MDHIKINTVKKAAKLLIDSLNLLCNKRMSIDVVIEKNSNGDYLCVIDVYTKILSVGGVVDMHYDIVGLYYDIEMMNTDCMHKLYTWSSEQLITINK